MKYPKSEHQWFVELQVLLGPDTELPPERIDRLVEAGTCSYSESTRVLKVSTSLRRTRMQLALEEARLRLVLAMRRARLEGEFCSMQVMDAAQRERERQDGDTEAALWPLAANVQKTT